MAAQIILVDRRQHPRDGVMGQLEDITYAAMRKYSVTREIKTGQINSPIQLPSMIH